mgnify:FL=1
MLRTVAVDFDDVIHEYRGWTGDSPEGDSIQEALAGCGALALRFDKMILFTTRKPEFVKPWLEHHGFVHLFAEITAVKPPYVCLIDDRVLSFDSSWEGIPQAADRFRAHWEPPEGKL